MSNHAFIVPTRFIDLNRDGSSASTAFGLRVFDDHDATYDNVLIESEEQMMAMSDREIVEMARGLNDKAAAIIDFAAENADGLYIWGDFVDWKALRGDPGPNT